MASMFIARKEYDLMMEKDRHTMSFAYLNLRRKWTIAGVEVSSDDSMAVEFDRVHRLWSAVCDR